MPTRLATWLPCPCNNHGHDVPVLMDGNAAVVWAPDHCAEGGSLLGVEWPLDERQRALADAEASPVWRLRNDGTVWAGVFADRLVGFSPPKDP